MTSLFILVSPSFSSLRMFLVNRQDTVESILVISISNFGFASQKILFLVIVVVTSFLIKRVVEEMINGCFHPLYVALLKTFTKEKESVKCASHRQKKCRFLNKSC